MVEISEDLKEIIDTTIESIKEGMKGKGCGAMGPIEFEMSVLVTKAAKGKFRIFIAEAGGDYAKENVSKISFKVMSPRDVHGTKFPGVWLTEK